MTTATTSGGLLQCPIPNSHQRLRQAHILWHQASDNYHDVDLFLTNVNSLIQELRNVTFILQSERHEFPDFDGWYKPWQGRLQADRYARWLKDTRNLVVKQGAIAAASHFRVKFLTYEEIEVASLLTDTASDLSVSAVLDREDFRTMISRIREAMRGEGDAVIAIERCWSTPDLVGAELLRVLGVQYGVLASMVLDAHVHLGSLDCISQQQTTQRESDFPNHSDRSYLLPCMMQAQASGTDFFSLLSLTKMSRGVRSLKRANFTPADVEWRYGMKLGERMESFDSLDPLKVYDHMVWSSKKLLKKDGSLARIMLLRDGKGQWNSHMIMASNRVEKYLLMHLLAQTIREQGCDALVEVGETWIADGHVTIAQLDSIKSLPNRKDHVQEAIAVRLATRDGLRKHAVTIFRRGPFGGLSFSDTTEDDLEEINYLKPIYRVWWEQNAFAISKGSRVPRWLPEYSDFCLCGSNRSFGVCCFPIIGGPHGPLQDSDELLDEGKIEMAEHHARAAITQYASWVRQHTALSLNASDREYSDSMVSIDCLALEGFFAKLERWASKTGNEDAVLDTYRKLEEVVGVPTIVRRLVALGAHWLMKIGRVEESLLELGRLGPASELTDTRALLLSLMHRDQEPNERLHLLEAAAQYALEDDERYMAILQLADELIKQGSGTQALGRLDEILSKPNSPAVIRSATALRWEAGREDADFDRLLSLMMSEERDNDRLAAASYLLEKEKPHAALEVLRTLLERKDPVANLIAAECEIRSGDCAAAGKRCSSIQIDQTSATVVRIGYAHLQAVLALHCGRNNLRDTALRLLIEVAHLDETSTLAKLIKALEQQANA